MTDEVPGPLVAAGEILKMLGVSRSRFRAIALHPNFPRPFQTLSVGSVWLRSDVEAYIAKYRQPPPTGGRGPAGLTPRHARYSVAAGGTGTRVREISPALGR